LSLGRLQAVEAFNRMPVLSLTEVVHLNPKKLKQLSY